MSLNGHLNPSLHTQPKADHVVELTCCCPPYLGLRYTARLGDTILVDRARDPEPEAARALLRLGLTGTVEFRRAGRTSSHTLPQEIARLAATSHEETAIGGRPRARRYPGWVPFIVPFAVLIGAVAGHVLGAG